MATALPLTACALLAAAAIVVRGSTARAWLLLASLTVAPAILVVHVWDASQVVTLRHHAPIAIGGALAGLLLVAALAVLFTRVPSAFPIAAVATVPFRIPITVGGGSSNLLLPLYLVVAAGALAWAIPRIAGRVEDPPQRAGALEWTLAATLVLYAAQTAYSADTGRALENVVFFYVPFAALFVLLARLRWTRRLAGRCLAVLTGLAVALAAVGYVEYATRHLFLNPKVIASNELSDYFRVNSLFFDPNIYGRFLAIVIVLLVAWMLWRRDARQVAWASLVLAFLFGGLVLTLSQSSFAALLVGLAVLGALRWSVKWALVASAVVALVAVVALAAGTSVLQGGGSTNKATSGRSDLVSGGVRLFASRPLLGHGSGSFPREYRRAEHVSAERATSASHTIPITVAAEQGLVGLAVYLALLWFAFVRLFRGADSGALRAGVAAAFAALVAHTLMYAAFLEDPLTWALLGVGTAAAAAAATDAREAAAVPAAGARAR
ncbi:MAG TPA: O-antigen ligase family protein [Solirubrobacteraceae bacterium]|nr:O-antigen ligase family protein [Solirubrobacteraceae bacterium]